MDYAERSSSIEGLRISVINDWVSGEARDAEEQGNIGRDSTPHANQDHRRLEKSRLKKKSRSFRRSKEKWNMTNNSLERMKSASTDRLKGRTSGRRD